LTERVQIAQHNLTICRRLWAGETLSHHSEFFDFDNVSLRPAPIKPVPILIGGSTQAACRRAVASDAGWMPARINFPTFEKRVKYLRGQCREASRPMVSTAVMPFTTIGRNQETALRGLDIKGLIDDAHNFSSWVKPSSGTFATLEDIGGVILAGSPDDIVRESRTYEQLGADHIVYDLRLRFDDWFEQIGLLGKEVLPALRA
jgi:alkanesulfonate monooxygenase SsuD/methylene tetrahydromethanopterin reductase-like flavin-dependent oxidoreductase (luciferase family)